MSSKGWCWNHRHPGALQQCVADITAPPHLLEVMVCVTGDLTLCIELHVSSQMTYIDSCPVTPKNSDALWEP